MTNYIYRDISFLTIDALKNMPVVVITGMRQTGKSTFLQNQPEFKNRKYISLDDFAQLEAAKNDPDGFINSKEPLSIDEAQKCPELLISIKKNVDKKRETGKFLLSGSANFSLLKNISESLAGRAIYLTMHPFTKREAAGNITKKPFLNQFFITLQPPKINNLVPIKHENILKGGMPSVCFGNVKNSFLWFKGYEQTYLERDVREISQIGDIISFRNLLHLSAMRTGQLLSPSQLGRDAKMNVATTSRYLSIFEASFIISRINPYLKNKVSRIIKSPKLYMNDSGLACYLAGVQDYESEPIKGALFETYVAQNLTGIIDATWPEARLCFWNVQGRHEVDFIIEVGNYCLAIEIKSGTRWDEKDLSGLKTFLSTTPNCKAAILAYNGTETVKLGDRLWAIPLSIVLS